VSGKPPENYYSRNLSFITIISYVGMMASIFLAFGYIRIKRQDKKKNRGLDKIEEMLESFGLLDF
jgi:Na+-transporting NADH:ubiquinone oxidoreductase subunit NqrC